MVGTRRTITFMTMCVALAACSGADTTMTAVTAPAKTEPSATRDPSASFQTDSLTYRLLAGTMGYEGDIELTFTNYAPTNAYVMNCAGGTALHFEKLVGNEWVYAWAPITLMCLSQPIVVQPFRQWRTHIAIFGGYPDCNCAPKFVSPEIAGVYRAVYENIYGSYKSGSESYTSAMPIGMRVSNPFVLAPQPR